MNDSLVADSIIFDNEKSRNPSAPNSQSQPVLDDQVPATTNSGPSTSVTDGAADEFAEVAERDYIPSPEEDKIKPRCKQ